MFHKHFMILLPTSVLSEHAHRRLIQRCEGRLYNVGYLIQKNLEQHLLDM